MPWFFLRKHGIIEIFTVQRNIQLLRWLNNQLSMVSDQVNLVIYTGEFILQQVTSTGVIHEKMHVFEQGIGNIGPEPHR